MEYIALRMKACVIAVVHKDIDIFELQQFTEHIGLVKVQIARRHYRSGAGEISKNLLQLSQCLCTNKRNRKLKAMRAFQLLANRLEHGFAVCIGNKKRMVELIRGGAFI